MDTFEVTRKFDGKVVCRYSSDAIVEWQGMELVSHDHTNVSAFVPFVPHATVYGGRRKLTKLELRALLSAEEQQAIDEFEAHFESMPFPTDVKNRIRTSIVKRSEATFIDLDEPDTAAGLGLYVALGKLAFNRIAEIVNG